MSQGKTPNKHHNKKVREPSQKRVKTMHKVKSKHQPISHDPGATGK